MKWVVQYRSSSGELVCSHHATRDDARDALVDQLLSSALTLWAIGQTYHREPSYLGQEGPFAKIRQSYFDRGDRFIHHAARLMETTEDSYVIAGAGGRKWVLCEV